MTSKRLAVSVILISSIIWAGDRGGRAEYVGGTIAQIPSGCQGAVQAIDSEYLIFYSGKASWRVPYSQINLLDMANR